MADNFVANAGAGGDTFAADDVSGVKYPRSKIVVGADGANDGDVSAANPLPVATVPRSPVVTNFTQAGVIALNTIIFTIDCLNYPGISLQVSSIGASGQLAPEWSNDNVNWNLTNVVTATGGYVPVLGAGIWVIPMVGRYFRLRVSTATTAGTTTVIAYALSERPQAGYAATPVNMVTGTISSINPGTNLIGDVGIFYRTNSTGSAQRFHVVAAASTNAAVIKNAPGRMIGFCLGNNAATPVYVKFHNQSTLPTAGAAVYMSFRIPAGGTVAHTLEGGVQFVTGLGMTIVTGFADADATAVAAGDVVGEIFFQ